MSTFKRSLKRMLSMALCVCMVLCLVPLTDTAARAAVTSLYVNGVNMIENPTGVTGASYDSDTSVLTLSGVNITTGYVVYDDDGFSSYCGIYTDGSLSIKLVGDNKITMPDTENYHWNVGIYNSTLYSDVSISGDGTLSVTSGDGAYNSFGICVDYITISGTTVSVKSMNSSTNVGISSNKLNIKDSTVDIKSESASSISCTVETDNMTIDNSEVTVACGSSSDSTGIRVYTDLTVRNNSDVEVSSYNANAGTAIYVFHNKPVTVDNSDVKVSNAKYGIKGQVAVLSGSLTSENVAYGIYNEYTGFKMSGGTAELAGTKTGLYCAGDITVSGGTLKAYTTTRGFESYDIHTDGTLTVSGGTVNAGDLETADSSNDTYSVYVKDLVVTAGQLNIKEFSVKSASPYGIYATGNVTVSGGTVNAAVGDATQNYNGTAIYADAMTVSGGSVNITVDAGTKVSQGIYLRNYFNMNGGIVKITALGNTVSYAVRGLLRYNDGVLYATSNGWALFYIDSIVSDAVIKASSTVGGMPTAKITQSEATNNKTVLISRDAALTITEDSGNSYVYSEESNEVKFTVKASNWVDSEYNAAEVEELKIYFDGTDVTDKYSEGVLTLELKDLSCGEYVLYAEAKNPAGSGAIRSNTITVEVEPVANSWEKELSISGWTYGEEPKEPSAAAKYGTVIYKYFSDADCKNEVSDISSANAGTYYVKAYVTAGASYTGLESEAKSFTVEKAVLTAEDFVFNAEDVTYDGDNHYAQVEAAAGVTGVGTITVKYYDEAGETVTDPLQVGKYTVKLDVAEGINYEAASDITAEGWGFEIKKINVTVTGADTEVTYDGAAIDISKLFGISNETAAAAAKYTVTNNSGAGTTDENMLTVTKAGTFTVKVEIAGSDTYGAASREITLTVKKAAGTGTVAVEDSTYGDAYGVVMSSETADIADYLYESADGKGYSSQEPPTNAGSYKLTVTFKENDLYAEYITLDEFTISPREITAELTGNATKVYDGTTDVPQENELEVRLEGILSNDNVLAKVKYSYNSPDAGTTGITAAIELEGEDAGNYVLKNARPTEDIGEIAPKEIKPTVSGVDEKYVYTGGEIKPAVTVKDGDTVLTEGKDYTVSYSEDCVSVGIKTITVMLIGNYKGEDTVVEYTVIERTKPDNTGGTGTGDNSNVILWVTVLVICTAALTVVVRKARKQK